MISQKLATVHQCITARKQPKKMYLAIASNVAVTKNKLVLFSIKIYPYDKINHQKCLQFHVNREVHQTQD